jgi:hypothetical protein
MARTYLGGGAEDKRRRGGDEGQDGEELRHGCRSVVFTGWSLSSGVWFRRKPVALGSDGLATRSHHYRDTDPIGLLLQQI